MGGAIVILHEKEEVESWRVVAEITCFSAQEKGLAYIPWAAARHLVHRPSTSKSSEATIRNHIIDY